MQLIFRTDDGDRFELRDASARPEELDGGSPLRDGQVVLLHGRAWLATRDRGTDAIRFVCTPVEDTPG
jgi:hypothetical protein